MASESNVKKDVFFIAVDGEPHSLHAFNWYLDHVYNSRHEVVFVHVYSPSCEDGGNCGQLDEDKRRRDALLFQYQKVGWNEKLI